MIPQVLGYVKETFKNVCKNRVICLKPSFILHCPKFSQEFFCQHHIWKSFLEWYPYKGQLTSGKTRRKTSIYFSRNQRIKLFQVLKGQCHKISKCWIFHQRTSSGPSRVLDIVKYFKILISARKFDKKSKFILKICFWLSKNNFRKILWHYPFKSYFYMSAAEFW